jgi:integrase
VANIQKRPNGVWRARYRDHAGNEHARHFERKIDAQRWLDEVTADTVRGEYVDPRAGRVTFEEYAERWRAAQVHRSTTATQVEGYLRRHVYPAIGARPLKSLRPSDLQGLVRSLADQLAPTTVEVIYRHVVAVLRAAAADRVIHAPPTAGVKLPKDDRDRRVIPLEHAQVLAVADAMPAHWRATVLFAAGTGLRQGEVLGLTTDRVDFDKGTVRVDRQMVTPNKGEPHFGPPKTAASNRTVPLPKSMADVLAEHLDRFPLDGPRTCGAGCCDFSHLVFRAIDGGAVRRQRISAGWNQAAAAAGVLDETFHATRHYYASVLIRHGESVKVVQARLGHASAVETLDTYSHLWPDDDDRTREAVDDAFGGTLAD